MVLPLRRHDLSVDTGDLDTREQASTVVSLDDIPAVDLASTNTAVVRALGTGETTLGPTVGPAICAKESVLLLQTEPPVFFRVGLHQAVGIVTEVELVGGAIRIPGFAEDDDVITLTERVGEDVDRAQVDIGVIPGSLAGRGTIEVPFRELIDGGGRFREGLHIVGKNGSANRSGHVHG